VGGFFGGGGGGGGGGEIGLGLRKIPVLFLGERHLEGRPGASLEMGPL